MKEVFNMGKRKVVGAALVAAGVAGIVTTYIIRKRRDAAEVVEVETTEMHTEKGPYEVK
jgi:hypothetical protein